MASARKRISFDEDEEKRKKRMASNRDSARRSRMKKQQQVTDLIAEMSHLQSQNKVIVNKINEVTNMFVGVASENNLLRAQISELNEKLYSLNSVLCFVEKDTNTMVVEPWQLPYPPQTGTFSANMFHS
ncbi:BZIP domain-containing protein [Heracleum sosnowskyi]|uniref:BZIP domain-containing protein n=1 Tax=Heracleum sosnowskyi TaxID=360622 RepID=A0AAD8I0H1_9APIA|nr:BZIP domain-containing protein [Heracleum sosnowskyi]